MTNEPTDSPVSPDDGNLPSATVQTVQKEGREYFEVAQDEHGKWNWVLWSANGRTMAINAITFDKRHDCTNSIAAIKRAITPQTKVVIAHE